MRPSDLIGLVRSTSGRSGRNARLREKVAWQSGRVANFPEPLRRSSPKAEGRDLLLPPSHLRRAASDRFFMRDSRFEKSILFK